MKLGSHVSFKNPGYLPEAIDTSIEQGANCMMIFLGPPQSARRVDQSKIRVDEYLKSYSAKISAENIVVHAPYIINPGNIAKASFAEEILIKEINTMNLFGAKYLVLHPGSHVNYSREESLNSVTNTIKNVLNKTSNVIICLETMSGKGTELGTTFEEIKFLIDSINSPRVAICLDTCHVWEAGYDLSKQEVIEEIIKYKDLIPVIHVNDSKNDIGAHKDRHENIGKGKIGLNILRNIIHNENFKHTINILETPWVEGVPIYKEEIEILK